MKFTKYLLILLTVLCSSCASLDISSLFESPLREHVYQRESRFADDEILIINMSGFIYSGKSRSLFSAGTTPDGIKKMLVKAQANRDLKAVILRINSPGGEVTATDMIHHELLLFKKRTGIPVYAIILSMGASGGYYLATAADEIYAHPTSILGSIGVIVKLPQIEKLANKIGYEEVIIKSGKNKDMGNSLKKLPEDQRKIFQNMVDSMYQRFISVVLHNRPGITSREDLIKIADGRVYTPEESLKHKLIDKIDYLPELIRDIKKKHELGNVRVYTYAYGRGYNANIYSRLNELKAPQINLINIDMNSFFNTQAGFYYVW
ncbi:MAG: signal peptide peptidase SppA, partial [Lentisphaeria bacterium]|nr:signal peptide peptidase SppA [Lentisphaeria bacterium]